MPHLVVLYTAELETETDMGSLCRSLADTLARYRDDSGGQPFPTGGIRVLAYPAAHSAVADGEQDCAFVYFNLRLASGRSQTVIKAAGENLSATIQSHFAPLLASRHIGLTLQIDEGAEVYNAKLGNLHPLFAKGS